MGSLKLELSRLEEDQTLLSWLDVEEKSRMDNYCKDTRNLSRKGMLIETRQVIDGVIADADKELVALRRVVGLVDLVVRSLSLC